MSEEMNMLNFNSSESISPSSSSEENDSSRKENSKVYNFTLNISYQQIQK